MQEKPLPLLRADVKIFKGPDEPDGSPTYNCFDPVKAQYYKISWLEFTILQHLKSGMTLRQLTDEINNRTTLKITPEELQEFFEEALRSRPELYIKDLEEKITLEKINESIVPMLPNISIFRDSNYDANPFLVHKYWWSLGMRASWNLFLIPQKMQEKRAAESQQEFTLASRLALSIGVMAQVNLAYLNYRDAFNQYQTALKSLDVRSRLAEISEKIRKTGEFHSIDVLNFRTDSLLARITSWRAYSFLKLAEEQLNYAIGRPFYLSDVRKEIEEEAQNFLLKSENYE